MKKITLILFSITALLTIGCEANLTDKDNLFSDQEALIEDLNSELELDRSQETIVRTRLHESRELHAHPGSLWKLAASLADILTEEQITKLLEGIKEGKFHDHGFNSFPDHEPKHKIHFEKKVEHLESLLDESQVETFNGIITDFNTRRETLETQWKNEEITFEVFKANIFALRLFMKASINNLLTDEQKELLETKKEEMKTDKRHFGKHAKNPDRFKEEKIRALELSEEQLEQFETLMTAFKTDMENLQLQYKEGNIDTDSFISSSVDLMLTKKSNHQEILTEKQITIIQIHHALTVKAHKRYRYSTKG